MVAIVVAAVMWPLLSMPAEEAQPQATVPLTTRSAHPFSDPVWYPLRSSEMKFWSKEKRENGPFSSLVACVYSNCGHKDNDPHGYWAVDFVGDYGDPVYAAGAGRLHVGERDPSCRGATGGAWVWIDHGGGIVSRYHHLGDITARSGDLVTPATRIGRMGPGLADQCGTHYLHFEVRRGGVRGARYNMGQLKACQSDSRVKYPRALDPDYATWDHLPYRSVDSAIPATHSRCVPDLPATPKRPAWLRATRGNNSATLRWSEPSKRSDRITISIQKYRPSMGSYSRPDYRRVKGSARGTTIGKLDGGRTYRFRVTFHNAAGNSAWSDARVVTPY